MSKMTMTHKPRMLAKLTSPVSLLHFLRPDPGGE